MKIRCIATDDEPLALEGLTGYIEKIPYLEMVGAFNSGLDLLQEITSLKPDLLFLDIEMPYLKGTDLVRNLEKPPLVIFTTAYSEFAIEGYELSVFDYLLKPISFERFLKSAEKVKTHFQGLEVKESKCQETTDPSPENWLFLKTDKRMERIFFRDILYIEALQNYVIVHTNEGDHISHVSLKGIFERLPKNDFIQVHKSFLVNFDQIKALEGWQLEVASLKIPVGRSFRESVGKKLGI